MDKLQFQLLLRQDPDSVPDELVERLGSSKYTPHASEHIKAAWRGDPEPLLAAATDQRAAPGEPWEFEHCAEAAREATMLKVAGQTRRADELWAAMVAEEVCNSPNMTPELAMAHGNLALAALRDEDQATAQTHLERLWELWPAPEPTVPLIAALLEAGVAPPAALNPDPAGPATPEVPGPE